MRYSGYLAGFIWGGEHIFLLLHLTAMASNHHFFTNHCIAVTVHDPIIRTVISKPTTVIMHARV
jgi:hypothetical protein